MTLRFTIRALLWETLLAAVAVAWWIDRSRQAKEIERLRRQPVLHFLFDPNAFDNRSPARS